MAEGRHTTNEALADAVSAMLASLDLDATSDAELADTPRRVSELFEKWLRPQALPTLRTLEEPGRGGDVVTIADIEYHAFCAHHLVPFFGRAHVAYKVDERIVGFGAIPRLIEAASRGPNLQERMGSRLVAALDESLLPRAVLVVLDARQLCVELSGHRCSPRTRHIAARGEWAKKPEKFATQLFGGSPGRID